jgi:hypothetical protein
MNSEGLVAVIWALQFAAFGWRINREISIEDQDRKTWLPLPDYINILSMLSLVSLGIIVPLATNSFPRCSRIAVAVSCALLAFHPISMAGHYRLYSKEGRAYYLNHDKDYPWLTAQEGVCVVISIVLATVTGVYVGRT